MTAAQVAARIKVPLAQWPGNCHAIAKQCLDAKVVRGRLCYGHFLGGIAKTGHFVGRPLAHHGWVELRDGRVWDPTRWVFEDVAPYIYVGRNAVEYNFGGNALSEALRGPYPAAAPGPVFKLALPRATRQAVGVLIGDPGWTGFATPQQVHWLANVNILKLGVAHARPLFRAISRQGSGAYIPLDNHERVLGR